MNAALKGEPHYIYGDGEQKRCFTYIDDIIEPMAKCVEKKSVAGMTFNVGSSMIYSINNLSDAIVQITGTKLKPKYLPDRANEVKFAVPHHSLAKRRLDYKDTTPLMDGLRKTWEYAKKLGYQKPIRTSFEIESDKIPENWR
jgi:UDP-glucose 4-epimerase